MRFISGRELNRAYYNETVAPIISVDFPKLRYGAALIGPGSDVLGYDSERSTDHGWGPRLLLFLAEDDYHSIARSLRERLGARLPTTFQSFDTSFANPVKGVRSMEPGPGEIAHSVEIHSVRSFVRGMLNIDLTMPLKNVDWMLMPQEQLLEITSGEVYRDDLGELMRLRTTLAWYPRDVWILLMAAQWKRIAQEEPFVARCDEAGDELGSRIVCARIVRDLVRLSFLIERRYAPYSKWLGTAFSRLSCGPQLNEMLLGALGAASWHERENHLCAAYETVAGLHNRMEVTPRLDQKVRGFHDRPYRVIEAERFSSALIESIEDQELRQICSTTGLIGAIDQFADSTDLLDRPDLCARLAALFTETRK
jgi:hypothetical protein